MKIKNSILLYPLISVVISIYSCNKEDDFAFDHMNLRPWIVYGSMTDRDGNTYKTIPIGTQTWMVQNLKTTKYNDGTSIPLVMDTGSWSNLSTPGYCWQVNDLAYRVTYGLLYNWYTVNTGKLCPKGWHVPSDAEWTKLTDYLGGENIAGGKLKESGFRHWNSPNTGATDESGFKAFPGGIRLNNPDAPFDSLREMGCWWTTAFGDDWAASRLMFYDNNRVQKAFYPKNQGLSVRCVWDY